MPGVGNGGERPAARALARYQPALGRLPFVPLGDFPTPVEPLDLGAVVPEFEGRAWIKREDRSAAPVGGNKVRKLEYLLGEAHARGRRAVVTSGGLASNHCLAACFHGARAGFDLHTVLFPQPLAGGAPRRIFHAICTLAARVHASPAANLTPLVTAAVRARLSLRGRRPYGVPPGGSSPLGAIGFANGGLELAEQVQAGLLEPPDAVFTAASSGGTAAGLAVGFALAGLPAEVVAVRVYPPPLTSTWWVRRLAQRARRRLTAAAGAPLPPLDPARLRVDSGQMGAGYAKPTEAARRAAEIAGELGFTTDLTYTAKAFAAFLDAAASPRYRDRRLVFLQTYDAAELTDGFAGDVHPDRLPRRLRRHL